MSFKVKTTSFEGPLDLLLDLIEKKKLFINDISLAQVTDDFISHVKRFENLPMGESAQFILVASILLLIKSRSLLPDLSLSEEEESDIKSLEIRLKIYQRIKEAGKEIDKIYGKELIYFPEENKNIMPVFSPDNSITLSSLIHSAQDAILRLPKAENLPKTVVKKVISLEEMIGNLAERVTKHFQMSFSEFTKEHKKNKVNVIISFLAMLELVKNDLLHVSQGGTYGEIIMESKEIGVPKY